MDVGVSIGAPGWPLDGELLKGGAVLQLILLKANWTLFSGENKPLYLYGKLSLESWVTVALHVGFLEAGLYCSR